MVRDKERTDVEVRSRLSRRIDRVLPLGEEDFVREAGRNDGNGGRVLRRAPGVGPRADPLEYRLRLRPHPDRPSRRLLSRVLRGRHPAPRDRSRVGGGAGSCGRGAQRDGGGHPEHRTPGVSAENGSLRIPSSEESASQRPGTVVWGFHDRVGEDGQVSESHLLLGSHFRATPRASRTEDPSHGRIVRAPDSEPAGSAGEGQAIVCDGCPLCGPVWSTGVGRIGDGIAPASRESHPTSKGVSEQGGDGVQGRRGEGGLPSVGDSPRSISS